MVDGASGASKPGTSWTHTLSFGLIGSNNNEESQGVTSNRSRSNSKEESGRWYDDSMSSANGKKGCCGSIKTCFSAIFSSTKTCLNGVWTGLKWPFVKVFTAFSYLFCCCKGKTPLEPVNPPEEGTEGNS